MAGEYQLINGQHTLMFGVIGIICFPRFTGLPIRSCQLIEGVLINSKNYGSTFLLNAFAEPKNITEILNCKIFHIRFILIRNL